MSADDGANELLTCDHLELGGRVEYVDRATPDVTGYSQVIK